MKNILVMGGSYFAGRVFVEELTKYPDYRIFVFNRGHIPLRMPGVTEIIGNRQDTEQISSITQPLEWHAVIDFCAESPADIAKLLFFLPGSVEQYIFLSTASVYAPTNDLPITETAALQDRIMPDLGPFAEYAYNKVLAELLLQNECDIRSIPYTCLRPAIIYGPYNYVKRESYFFDLILNENELIVPLNRLALFSFIYVVDLARIIIECLGNNKVFNQVFNSCAPELVSYSMLIGAFSSISGKNLKYTEFDIKSMEERQIYLPFPCDTHLIYSSAKLQSVLEFQFTPFIEGMRQTWQYYKYVKEKRSQIKPPNL